MSVTLNTSKYVEPTNTLIDFNVTVNGETFDFTYNPADEAPLSLAIRAMVVAGTIPSVAAYVPPPPLVPGKKANKIA